MPLPLQVMTAPPLVSPSGPERVRVLLPPSMSVTVSLPEAEVALVVSGLPVLSAMPPARPSSERLTEPEPITATLSTGVTSMVMGASAVPPWPSETV